MELMDGLLTRRSVRKFDTSKKISKDTLLRRVNLSAGVAGNFNKLSIGNISLNLDNSTILGEIGLINDKNINLYAGLKTTVFNVDDYFPETVVNNPDFSWAQNVDARFQKIMFNPDIYAWMDIPGTGISFPILQSAEDEYYYLSHNESKEADDAGCIYTEYFNRKDFSDPNTVIYGRNVDGRFAQLHQYQDRDFFAINIKNTYRDRDIGGAG